MSTAKIECMRAPLENKACFFSLVCAVGNFWTCRVLSIALEVRILNLIDGRCLFYREVPNIN